MNRKKLRIIWFAAGLLVAFGLWYLIFVFPAGNFWLKISLGTAFLAAFSLFAFFAAAGGRAAFKSLMGALFKLRPWYILLGIGSAAVLYAVFWFGNWFLRLLFSAAGPQISNVYASKGALSAPVIAVLLALVTSPAEELFWRGFVQRYLAEKITAPAGFILSVFLYSLVHIWTLNVPLMLAAAVAGFVWGLIYWRVKSLVPVIISHALWSVSVFILFPFT